MDSQLASSGTRFVVPAGAYASLLAPTPSGQAKAYTFSKTLSHLLESRRLLQHGPEEHRGLSEEQSEDHRPQLSRGNQRHSLHVWADWRRQDLHNARRFESLQAAELRG